MECKVSQCLSTADAYNQLHRRAWVLVRCVYVGNPVRPAGIAVHRALEKKHTATEQPSTSLIMLLELQPSISCCIAA